MVVLPLGVTGGILSLASDLMRVLVIEANEPVLLRIHATTPHPRGQRMHIHDLDARVRFDTVLCMNAVRGNTSKPKNS